MVFTLQQHSVFGESIVQLAKNSGPIHQQWNLHRIFLRVPYTFNETIDYRNITIRWMLQNNLSREYTENWYVERYFSREFIYSFRFDDLTFLLFCSYSFCQYYSFVVKNNHIVIVAKFWMKLWRNMNVMDHDDSHWKNFNFFNVDFKI